MKSKWTGEKKSKLHVSFKGRGKEATPKMFSGIRPPVTALVYCMYGWQ